MVMGKLFLVFSITALVSYACGKSNHDVAPATITNPRYLLALGDSYTIGEGVAEQDRFAWQTAQLLQTSNFTFTAPEIIAQTGWTTGNLISRLNTAPPQRSQYDAVTLLIGVNNQFQHRSQSEYRTEFTTLLQQAIRYAGNNSKKVTVLSIPDWGVTPFANGYNRALIAAEIDSFNNINQSISLLYNVNYINITAISRQAATDGSLLAADSLHPSSRMYRLWAEKLQPIIQSSL